MSSTVLEEKIPTVVLPNFVNVAINGTAAASSTGWGGVPTRVNDGNTNGYYNGYVEFRSPLCQSTNDTLNILRTP